jgi:hypothetical protein
MLQVINWAFGLLLTAAANAQSSSNAARSSSSAAPAGAVSGAQDAKPLVALTGLLRVLWHCIHVEGLPVELRGVLLVAMALRNLLLVAALPLWARKAVAAQLRAWQKGISEAHACNPVMHTGWAKLVHLLRVLEEVRQQAGGLVHSAAYPAEWWLLLNSQPRHIHVLWPQLAWTWALKLQYFLMPFKCMQHAIATYHSWLNSPSGQQPPFLWCALWQAEQLCQHGWDHPSLLAALQSVGSNPANPAQCPEVAQQQQQHPGSGSQLGIEEHPGLVLLRLTYLELMGEQAAYLDLAMAGQQWNHAVSALLRSGDRWDTVNRHPAVACCGCSMHCRAFPATTAPMLQHRLDLSAVESLERIYNQMHIVWQRLLHMVQTHLCSRPAWSGRSFIVGYPAGYKLACLACLVLTNPPAAQVPTAAGSAAAATPHHVLVTAPGLHAATAGDGGARCGGAL